MTKFQTQIAGVNVDLTVEELPAASLAFVIAYGLRQYLSDGAAVSKVHTTKERNGEAKSAEEIATEKREGVEARVAKLLAGTVAERTRNAEPVDPVERELDRLARDFLRNAARATGKKLPKADSDEFAALVAKVIESESHGPKLRKEAERRVREAGKIDVSGLFD